MKRVGHGAHARQRRRGGVEAAGVILGFVLVVAGCTGGSVSPPPAASPTPAASPSPAAASPSPILSTVQVVSPSPAASVTMASRLYPYSLTVPGSAVGIPPTLATTAWDGKARIDSADAQTDWLVFEGDRTFFVYGAPTATSLDAFAASSQKQVADWHGCPSEAESTADVRVGGAPGRLHLFHCQGLLVMKIMAIKGGFGLVLNQIAPGANPASEQALLLERVADLTWTK